MTLPIFPAPSPEPTSASAIDALIGEPPASRTRRLLGWFVPLVLVGAAVLAWRAWSAQSANEARPRYVTEAVTRGAIKVTVTANGTLQPTRSVSIGSELSGTVAAVKVDVNDVVKKGQVLVALDTAMLRDQAQRAQAALRQAEAKVVQTAATVNEARTSLARLEEVARLSGGQVPARSELDAARASVERAQADARSAVAGVSDAQAVVSTAATNLSKAAIASPVEGIVLTRSVEPGNAVAASLQAVTLFTLAEDLHRLQLSVAIDEADVGTVAVGQPAEFTVAAFPRRHFPAVITRVAYGSTITDNVVTYTALLTVDNADLALRPGMTATVTITAAQRDDALRVPNTALRFTPAAAVAAGGAPASGAPASPSVVSRLLPRPPAQAPRRAAGEAGSHNGALAAPALRKVWVLDAAGAPTPVEVNTGLSDGHYTEVTATALQAGQKVITDQLSAAAR